MNAETIPRFYTYQDIAVRLKVCVRTAAKWCKEIKVFRLGNTVRIAEPEFLALIQQHGVKRTRRPDRKG